MLDMDMLLMFVSNKKGGGIQDCLCHHNNGGVILRHGFDDWPITKIGLPILDYLPTTPWRLINYNSISSSTCAYTN